MGEVATTGTIWNLSANEKTVCITLGHAPDDAELFNIHFPSTDEIWTRHLKRAMVSALTRVQAAGENVTVTHDESSPRILTVIIEIGVGWDLAYNAGIVGVHSALLKSNQVLFWSYEDHGVHAHLEDYGAWSLLDLTSGEVTVHANEQIRNIFCSGQAMLGDGRLLIVGGDRTDTVMNRTVKVFDPDSGTMGSLPDLPTGRWYPTIITLPNEGALILGGGDVKVAPDPEPNRTWQKIDVNSLTYSAPSGSEFGKFDAEFAPGLFSYPFAFMLPKERLFVHLVRSTRIIGLPGLNFSASSTKKLTCLSESGRTYGLQGTAVLLPLRPTKDGTYNARVLMIGGGNPDIEYEPDKYKPQPAQDTCEELDCDAADKKWIYLAKMPTPRIFPDAVILPSGQIAVVNGSASGTEGTSYAPVMTADIYDPVGNSWTTFGSMSVYRMYHSTAILIPDGRVLVAGHDQAWNPPEYAIARHEVEVFGPPYLSKGPRPVTLSWPRHVNYNGSFKIEYGGVVSVKKVVLVRCGSATHSFNSDQRLVELKIEKNNLSGVRSVALKAPPDGYVAPPGTYMVFLLSESDVPSIGRFLVLN